MVAIIGTNRAKIPKAGKVPVWNTAIPRLPTRMVAEAGTGFNSEAMTGTVTISRLIIAAPPINASTGMKVDTI